MMGRRKRKSKNHDELLRRQNENIAGKKITVEGSTFETGTKKMEKLFDISQKMKLSNKDKGKLTKEEKRAVLDGEKEYESTRGLSDGGKKTYFKDFERVRKEIYYKYGISDVEKIEYKHFKGVISDRIESGQSPNTIKKVVQAVNFVQSVGVETGVFKNLNLTDHEDMLQYLKNEDIERSYSNSHRYKADENECQRVIEELYTYKDGKYKDYAELARLQLLTGGRRSEVIGLETKEVHVNEQKVEFLDAKGGLDNTVWCNHWTFNDKTFVSNLIDSSRERHFSKSNIDDEKIFRFKDKNGNYMTEDKVAERLNRLVKEAAERIGVGEEGKTFTSHSLRGGYAHGRVKQYSKLKSKPGGIDAAIQQKIEEQPRLKSRYQKFEKHIKDKVKKENRAARQIQDYEKIQWLVSVDLNHSRQDIVRYYVPTEVIKSELSKY